MMASNKRDNRKPFIFNTITETAQTTGMLLVIHNAYWLCTIAVGI